MLLANTFLIGSWPLKMAQLDSTVALKCVSYGKAKALGYLFYSLERPTSDTSTPGLSL